MLRISVAAALVVVFFIWLNTLKSSPSRGEFDGARAYADVTIQVDFGPRVTGSEASLRAGDYIRSELRDWGWSAEFQTFAYRQTQARNIIARGNVGKGDVIILGAHYDSRRRADQDEVAPDDAVPGANDGASGTAVLLELARTLDLHRVPNEIWLAFFDAEDNGGLDGWDWIVGSTYMAAQLTDEQIKSTEAMILVDMVGDADQQFYFDLNSNAVLSARLWATAARLGYGEHFIPVGRWSMLDDHTPFARRGIPSVDIIDFDYPVWHTTRDTADQVSPGSLERAGRTLEAFLETEEK